MKHTSEIVLRALLMGHKVHIRLFDGKEPIPLALAEDMSVCMVGTREGEDILLHLDMSLTEFIRACEKMPEEDRISIVCNLSLQASRA